jgi:hypothetical protein
VTVAIADHFALLAHNVSIGRFQSLTAISHAPSGQPFFELYSGGGSAIQHRFFAGYSPCRVRDFDVRQNRASKSVHMILSTVTIKGTYSNRRVA